MVKSNTVDLITQADEKKRIARCILEALPEWFGIAEAREDYIEKSAAQTFLVAKDHDKEVGFLCLKETGRDTVELCVMGVLKKYHRMHYGTELVNTAKEIAKAEGFSFLQVKTVQMGRYEEYDATNRFYLSCGFKEFEVFPDLWDANNPCQIYVMSIG